MTANKTENPATIHGRLMEAVHISGYSFERACSELDWLMEDERWEELGFQDGAAFVESITALFSTFRISIEERKPLSKKLTAIASQRAVAKALGVNEATVNRDVANATKRKKQGAETNTLEGEFVADATPEHEWFNDPGIDPIKAAQKEAKKAEKTRQREQQNEAIRSGETELPDGKYAVIYADPPWKYQLWSGEGVDRAAENHFPTMEQDEIEALPIAALAADDCALFIWAVMPLLPKAFKVIEAWGFEYKTCAFNWVKTVKDGSRPATGMGYWTRANAEVCLLATRGSPKRINADVPQVIVTPRMEHSVKPDEAASRIERLLAGPYIELFARRPRDGWAAWGNQA